MISVVCWSWGKRFAPTYVNNLRSMLERHLHLPHRLHCVTNEPGGIDARVRIVPAPPTLPGDMRCRRRLWHFARERIAEFGDRILAVDLDLVVLDDITSLIDRAEPIVCWRVGYANVFTGAFVLFDVGALDGLWRAYKASPVAFPASTGERNASETAMLTHWIRDHHIHVAEWTERDGLVMWFGDGYEDREHHGIGPSNPTPPKGTKLVMLGGMDKYLLDERRYAWIRENWR